MIEKWGKYLGLYWSDIETFKSKLSGTKDECLIGVARIIPFVPSVAISALRSTGDEYLSVAKHYPVFFRFNLGAVGWQAGNVYKKYAERIASLEMVLISFFSLSCIVC